MAAFLRTLYNAGRKLLILNMLPASDWSSNHAEYYGYVAAIIACFAFGSFAVPIKSAKVEKADVDPLVLQTYKIVLCFVTSWLVLPLGIPFKFTRWGFVSGLFMAPGGTAGYYAVQKAGIATSHGIWCSLKVLVAFLWGIIVFHEPVHSKAVSLLGVIVLMIGLLGMSLCSYWNNHYTDGCHNAVILTESQLHSPLLDESDGNLDGVPSSISPITLRPSRSPFFALSKRWKGVIGAIFDGAYGGCVFVPMHYAATQEHPIHGLEYLISFAFGCLAVVSLLWLFRFLYHVQTTQSLRQGRECLPELHLFTIGPYAALAGLLWSVGNASTILSVAYLGQGVGYGIVQSQLLVAGLWANLWYREISNVQTMRVWFAFASLTLIGITLLSIEHSSSSTHVAKNILRR